MSGTDPYNDRLDAPASHAGSTGNPPVVDRKTWIRLCAQELMILRTGMSPSEGERLAATIWGSSGHLGPMIAAALLDRMLQQRYGDAAPGDEKP
jgi:hypothetical protein